MQVFYGNDCLPYKDSARSVHYPIVGNSFVGANNTTQIRFYVRDIGGVNNVTWVAISKLPNGQIGNQVLSSIHLDSELNEYYVALDLSSYYTQLKGDVYISLNGYQGGVQVSQDAGTGIYTITGTPIIEATGSIKLAINYSTQLPLGQHFNVSDLQQVLGAMSDKANIVNTVQVVADISQEDFSGYDVGQLFYCLTNKQYYQATDTSPYYSLAENVGVLGSKDILCRWTSNNQTVSTMYSMFRNKLFVLSHNNYDYLFQIKWLSGYDYQVLAVNLLTRAFYYNANANAADYIQSVISDTYKIEYVERTNNANRLYGTDASGNQITIPFADLLRNYIDVTDYQSTVSVIANPLTNINGWVLSSYEKTLMTIGGYSCYKITRGGSNLTVEYAQAYMKAMTGSEYLPRYDYNVPKNAFMLMADGTMLKPQYDNSNGLVLYIMKRLADVNYVNSAIETIRRNAYINVDTSEYPTLQDFLNSEGEDGYLYLYPIDTQDLTKGYYQYIWESNGWQDLGTTQIDLSAYALTSYVDNRDNYIIGLCNNLYYELGQTNDEINRLAGIFSLYGSYYVGGHILYVSSAQISDNTITLVGTVSDNTLSVTPVTFFYNKDETDDLLDEKVDKTSSAKKVYGTDSSGNQTTFDVDYAPGANGNIVRRDSETSQIMVPLTPTANGHAASKSYVDGSAKSLVVSMNNSTYVITFTLKDANNNTLSTQTVDLPFETVVVDGDYDPETKSIVLTLVNGNTISIPVEDLVDGLVSNTDLASALSNYYTKSQIDAQNVQMNEKVELVAKDVNELSRDLYSNNYVIGNVLYNIDASVTSNTLTISGSVSSNTLSLVTTFDFYTKQETNLFGKSIEMSLDSQTYVLTISLKDANGNVISTQTANLPLESLIVDGSYDSVNEQIVLELQSGQTITIPVSDLVNGLVSQDLLDQTLLNYATKQELLSQNNNLQSELNNVKYELDNLANLLNLVVDNFVCQHKLYSKTTTVSDNVATIVGTISGNVLELTTSAN